MAQASTNKVAVISGANRGIGLETARLLGKQGIRVVLTSRNAGSGEAVTDILTGEGLDVIFHALDVTSEESVASLGEFVRSRCDRVDILVNNAGIFLDRQSAESGNKASALQASIDTLRTTMEANVYGALLLAQEMVPIMKQQRYGRIVNVSSGLGQLSDMEGHSPAYRISKTALNALTRILAAETKDHNILVNSICPGWVRTDMGGANAERSVAEGADTIVWAAMLPDDGPTGGFFRDRKPIAW